MGSLLNPSVDELRARARELEDGFARAWELLKEHGELLGLGALTSAVAVALDELGGTWLRCEANQLVGRKLCGAGYGLLDALLNGAIDVLAISQLCEITKVMVAAADTGPVRDALAELVGGLQDLAACQGVEAPTPLAIAAPSLSPTLAAYAELAPVV